jgi:coenzyme F420-0:L-glutamate ligase
MKSLHLHAIQTAIFHRGEDLVQFIVGSVPGNLVQEKMILAVTSKIVSLAEGRLVSKFEIDKATLVKRESEVFLGEVGYGTFLTIKEGLFIPSAGIDESNSEGGEYILYPPDPVMSAKRLWEQLREIWGVRELGILLTDSHTSPLRRGVTGICLSYWGLRAVRNMEGSEDLFGRKLQMTRMNLADGLAAAAVLMMGEGSESRPLVVIANADVEYDDVTRPDELKMPLQDDLYYPLFRELSREGNSET